MNVILLVLSAAALFAFLALTDGTSIQIIGLASAMAAAPAWFVFRRRRKRAEAQATEPLPMDAARREFVMAGGLLGLAAYIGRFSAARLGNQAMADYRPTLEPVDIDLKIAPQPSFSLSSPQAGVVDGPYYALNTPEARVIAREGTAGTPMIFQGRVVDESGAPIEGAVIEIWHADGNGEYDNESYNCRGHQFTNAEGCFEFRTVKPFGYGVRSLSLEGVVDYRSAHLHIKLRKDDRSQTTQIWFPDDPRNATDLAYLAVKDVSTANQKVVDGALYSRFDFIL